MTKRWTKKTAMAVAKKYSSKSKFIRCERAAYRFLLKHGFIDEACAHMVVRLKVFWTEETAAAVAKKYSNRRAFTRMESSACNFLRRRGLLEEACAHMEPWKWTVESAVDAAKKYSSRKVFQREEAGAYNFLRQHDFLDAACAHMDILRKSWTEETAFAAARKYSTTTEFQKAEPGALSFLRTKGLLGEACSHMASRRVVRERWTVERAIAAAKKYSSRTAFAKSKDQHGYNFLARKGLLDEACAHMDVKTASIDSLLRRAIRHGADNDG